MKNYEKYADEIKEYNGINICSEFIKPHILEADNCNGIDCQRCAMIQMIWLLEDYKEPETDWSTVEVDTPILVRDTDTREGYRKNGEWIRRYFAKFEYGVVYAWVGGRTSWNETNMNSWEYAKLAESEEGGTE